MDEPPPLQSRYDTLKPPRHCHWSHPASCISPSKVSSQGRLLKSSVLTQVARGPRFERHDLCHSQPGVSTHPRAGVATSSATLYLLPVRGLRQSPRSAEISFNFVSGAGQLLLIMFGVYNLENCGHYLLKQKAAALGCFVMNVTQKRSESVSRSYK